MIVGQENSYAHVICSFVAIQLVVVVEKSESASLSELDIIRTSSLLPHPVQSIHDIKTEGQLGIRLLF